MRMRCGVAALVLTAVAGVSAQSPADTRPAFDVVSVKPNTSGEAGLHLGVTPDRLRAINVPLTQFIRAAYTLQVYQIAGAPSWVESERFDITGLSDADLTAPVVWTPGHYAPLQLLMQSGLADRFKLVAHIEHRPARMYALVQRSPERTRTALVQSTRPCPANCGMTVGPGTLSAHGVPVPQFAELLSGQLGQLVVDETGLSGRFDFDVRWDPAWQRAGSDGPSLFTALQEQLGLRLDPRREPIPVLVIDATEHPSPD
jgi:uncharacterized protein (TIGR03435 family)